MAQFHSPGLVTCERYLNTVEVAAAPLQQNHANHARDGYRCGQGAFAWAGITLSPAVGALLMSLSTIVVALNAQLLRRVDLKPVLAD